MAPFTASRLIADRAEYERITAEMIAIADEIAAGNFERRESLRLMSLLCEAFDREHADPLPAAKSHELLGIVMESHGLRQADMVGLLGDAAAVSSILAGRRPIPRAAAVPLKERFGYDFPSLIAAEAVARAARKRPAAHRSRNRGAPAKR